MILYVPIVPEKSYHNELSKVGIEYSFLDGKKLPSEANTVAFDRKIKKRFKRCNPTVIRIFLEYYTRAITSFGCEGLFTQRSGNDLDIFVSYLPAIKKKYPRFPISVYFDEASTVFHLDHRKNLEILKKYTDRLFMSEEYPGAIWTPPPGREEFFRPLGLPKIYELCFIGRSYTNYKGKKYHSKRIDLIQHLVKSFPSHRICLVGDSEWSKFKSKFITTLHNSGSRRNQARNRIANEIYNQSKIVLDFNACNNPKSMSLRVPNVLLSGSMLLTSNHNGYADIFKNEVALYNDKDDIVNQIKKYLSNDKLIKQMGERGREFAIKNNWTTKGHIQRCVQGNPTTWRNK